MHVGGNTGGANFLYVCWLGPIIKVFWKMVQLGVKIRGILLPLEAIIFRLNDLKGRKSVLNDSV